MYNILGNIGRERERQKETQRQRDIERDSMRERERAIKCSLFHKKSTGSSSWKTWFIISLVMLVNNERARDRET